MKNWLQKSLSRYGAAVAIGGMVLSPGAWAEQPDAEAIERGKAATVACVACHQADGSGMNN